MNETLCSIDWVKVTQVLQALLTPVIGIATVVVGVIATQIQRQQAETNRRQYRLALFERRMKIFSATWEFITLVTSEFRVESMEPLYKLTRDTREHHLLFGAEIGEYIGQLWKKGKKLHSFWLASGPSRVLRPEHVADVNEISIWFDSQAPVAQEKFLKYLDFREP